MNRERQDLLPLRERFGALLAASERGDAEALTELYEAENELEWEVFGAPPELVETDVSPDDPRLALILDALAALGQKEPDDSAHPWRRAALLAAVGRHLEAAADYLEAGRRFENEFATTSGVTGDEDSWASTALWRAAQNFVHGGQPLAARALLGRLRESDRLDVAALIDRATTRA
jgi:hypothetical protein